MNTRSYRLYLRDRSCAGHFTSVEACSDHLRKLWSQAPVLVEEIKGTPNWYLFSKGEA
jgi:hypothetical protein